MSRIQADSCDGATEGLQATVDAESSQIGMVPNILGTFANAPAALKAYLRFSDVPGSGRLTPVQQEIIALSVKQANARRHILSAYAVIAKAAETSEESISNARARFIADVQTNAIAAITTTLIEQAGELSDEDVAAAKAAGVDDGLLEEIVGNVAMNILASYTSHAAATAIDSSAVSS